MPSAAPSVSRASASCSTNDNGVRHVKGQIRDKDLDATTYSADVTVNNVAPTITISGAASVNEGSTYSLTLGAVSDPGTDLVTSYVVHWGDGTSDTYTTAGAHTHTYADGPATRAITVDLVAADGTHLNRANPLSVAVNNVAPTGATAGPSGGVRGQPRDFTLSAADVSGVDQAAGFEFRQMRTRGLRRDAGLVRQLARGQRAAGHQRRQHVGARGIADERGDHGNVGACFHSSMIAEALTTGKRVLSLSEMSSVIASEAKQSIAPHAEAWIASSLRSLAQMLCICRRQ